MVSLNVISSARYGQPAMVLKNGRRQNDNVNVLQFTKHKHTT